MNNKIHAGDEGVKSVGVYHNDYSPRYKDAYDIYEKARLHMKSLRKKQGEKVPKDNLKRPESES